MKLKNKGISHKQHVANTNKPKPIESFRGKPLLLRWCLDPLLKTFILDFYE